MIRTRSNQTTETRTYSQIDGVKTISILELVNEKAEADSIAAIIEKLIGGTGFHAVDTGKIDNANLFKPQSYSDFAVLYRTHDQSRILADRLERSGIPIQIASRDKALNQIGLAELVSLLKIVEGCGSYSDYNKAFSSLLPGVGKKTLNRFSDWCLTNKFSLQEGLTKVRRFPVPGIKASKQHMLNDFCNRLKEFEKKLIGLTVDSKLRQLFEISGLARLVENNGSFQEALNNLLALACDFGENTRDFFAMTALHTDSDTYTSRAEKVSLMTMHAAKGLEFPVVFIAGCEQDFIPFKRSTGESIDIAEERRLFYVAMTRAMDRLYFTRARKRRIFGRTEHRKLSPFVGDIENHLKKDDSPQIKEKKRKDDKQLRLF
jgi:superfamily I DNA/RNA helicase